jgi:hypothetical protein
MSDSYTMGYTDFRSNIAQEVCDARHFRYIKTPSGRKLYMPIGRADDAEEIAEIRHLVSAANLSPRAMR